MEVSCLTEPAGLASVQMVGLEKSGFPLNKQVCSCLFIGVIGITCCLLFHVCDV